MSGRQNHIIVRKRGLKSDPLLGSGLEEFIETLIVRGLFSTAPLTNTLERNILFFLKFIHVHQSEKDNDKITLIKEIAKEINKLSKDVGNNHPITNDFGELVNEVEKHWDVKSKDFPYLSWVEKKQFVWDIDHHIKSTDIISCRDLKEKLTNEKSRCPKSIRDVIEDILRDCERFKTYRDVIEKKADQTLESTFSWIIDITANDVGSRVLYWLYLYSLGKRIGNILGEVQYLETDHGAEEEKYEDEINSYCRVAERLQYINKSGQKTKLPVWAKWFCKAGQVLLENISHDRKLVVVFSLPLKAYVALFLLLGFEARRADLCFADANFNSQHFKHITSLERGSPLLWLDDHHRWKRCHFEELLIRGEQKFAVLDVPSQDNTKIYLQEKDITKIRLAVDPNREVTEHQKGHALKGYDFLSKYYDRRTEVLLRYLSKDLPLSIIVGSESRINNEISEARICVNSSNGEHNEKGTLQDLLRFGNFLSDFDCNRGYIVSDRTESLDICSLKKCGSQIVIFDGERYFLKMQDAVSSPIEVVILDRTNRSFDEARDEILDRYYDRTNEMDVNLFENIPPSIECLMFEEEM